MKRKARRGIEAGIPLLGVTLILGSVLVAPQINAQLHVTILLIGVLILQAGPWGLTRRLLPNERDLPALRKEGDHFLGLLRVLSRAPAPNEDAQEEGTLFTDTVKEMQDSVERMAEIAS